MMNLKLVYLSTVLLLICLIAGCSNDYFIDSVVTGTIEDINTEEKVLVIIGVAKVGGKTNSVYEIPVSDVEEYEIGQKVEVTIYSNTDEDIWDPDNMKIEIKPIN